MKQIRVKVTWQVKPVKRKVVRSPQYIFMRSIQRRLNNKTYIFQLSLFSVRARRFTLQQTVLYFHFSYIFRLSSINKSIWYIEATARQLTCPSQRDSYLVDMKIETFFLSASRVPVFITLTKCFRSIVPWHLQYRNNFIIDISLVLIIVSVAVGHYRQHVLSRFSRCPAPNG